MTALAGQLALLVAATAAGWTLLSCALAGMRGGAWPARARMGLLISCGAFVAGAGVLLAASARSDFRLAYVAMHTDRSLALPLRLAALWSGEQGSLLLWATLAAGVGAALAVVRRRGAAAGEAVALAIPGAMNLTLALLLAFAANPFALSHPVPADGRGMHPELQHWAMIAHPPLLFLGYAASMVPCAIVCGALAAGRSKFTEELRRWAIFTWLSLGAGIVLGARWAYVELGWGGYWAWDPVENASLLPWLSATALVHTTMVRRSGTPLKSWAAVLACATFLLSLVSAAITRSGLVQSVHSFAGSAAGSAIVVLALLMAGGVGTLLVLRRTLLRSNSRIERPLSREGASLIGVLLLVVMAAAALTGTLIPLFARLVSAAPVSMSASFYVRTVVPLGLGAIALMAISPVLGSGRGRAVLPASSLTLIAAAATILALLAIPAGLSHPVVLACVAILAVTVLTAGWGLIAACRAFARSSGYHPIHAAARIIDGNHRRYGGQVAHAGIAVMVLGLAGSSLLNTTTTATVRTGDSFTVGRHTLRLDNMSELRGVDYSAVEAAVSFGGKVLHPERRFYDKFGQSPPRVALAGNWREDVYLVLTGWEANGTEATFQVRLNPLAAWIWIGAGVAAIGGLFSLLPRLLPRPADVELLVLAAGPTTPSLAVHARGLGKEIDGRAVLSGIDLDLPAASCTALLGPNGAGKTTLLRILAGLSTPDAGSLRVLDAQAPTNSDRRRIGFIGHQPMLYRDLTVLENLVFFARLYDVPRPTDRARELLELLALAHRADDPVSALSRGLTQRVAIARALIHSPDLLIADEPFTGLDAALVELLINHLAALRHRGVTIIFSDHDAGRARGLASHILALDAGRLVTPAPQVMEARP